MSKKSADSNFIIRFFFIHCFLHIYHILTNQVTTNCFTPSRFKLFQKIERKYTKGKNALFNNLLVTFKWHIIGGAIITTIFVSLNLLVPTLIKMFMHFMHGHHSQKSQVQEAAHFIKILVGIQFLRIIFSEHTRRIFHELAIRIESILARKLVIKSLNITQKTRRDIPESQILQLENVDLKLVFNMFNNFYFLFEAPLTIIIALIMLFVQNRAYGFIGGYWFLIAFLLHRQLDEHMTHCNQTKLGLIEKRSKLNYEILNEIKQAKIIGWEDIIVQKNNDLFEEENHDHYLFYFYNSLYDIILLMLPVLVVVTICVWDYGQAQPIKVEQVYMMLSLLGICYEPMKQFRTISISFHDGLRSINRLQQYFDMPEQQICSIMNHSIAPGHLIIDKGTAAQHVGDLFDFAFKTNLRIEASPGDRLVVLGRRNQGKTSFLNMICGLMTGISGNIKINGHIAYLPDQFFFMKSRVRDNIAFYNQDVSQEEIDYVATQLGLVEELKQLGGLNSVMDDINLYTRSQLQRISIARVLCSKADIYILDTPFEELDRQYEDSVQYLLRQKQKKEKILVISTFNHLDFLQTDDKILLIAEGVVNEFGRYSELLRDKKSLISKFYKSKEDQLQKRLSQKNSKKSNSLRTPLTIRSPITALSPSKAKKALNRIFELSSDNSKDFTLQLNCETPSKSTAQQILEQRIQQIKKQKQQTSTIPFFSYIKEFMTAAPIIEIIFILAIIACAELLHVFIHFWIGHLQQEHGQNSYLKFQNMIIIEVALTLLLSGILYYEGDVSSMIAIIQGNNLYKQSLECLSNKRISWFTKQYFVRIADRFNHDYEEVFIACHALLGIYKNIIILLTTIFFISSNGIMAALIFAIIAILYISIFLIFRKVEKLIVRHYYDFKYAFVKSFEESLQGAVFFRVFGSKDYLIKRAELKYRKLASYKLAEKYTSHALSIVSDLTSMILLASVVSYGLQNKIHNSRFNIALIATSIHLLMNGSQVLKSIVKDTISFETFFLINIVPFLEINTEKFQSENKTQKARKIQKPEGYAIHFDKIKLKQTGDISAHNALDIRIPEDQTIAIYQSDDSFRNLLLYGLTQNIGIIADPHLHESQGRIIIGGVDIREIDPQYRSFMISVVMTRNFYLSGTLRDNLVRKIDISDQKINHYIHLLKIDHDVQDYDTEGLDAPIYFQSSKINYQLTKKFAVARALIYQSKIVIIKDTSIYIDSISILTLLRQNIPNCTIIILTNKIESVLGAQRIISMQNHSVLEDGKPQQFIQNENSQIGQLLRQTNLQGFLYMNKVSKIINKKKKKNPNRLKKKGTMGAVKMLLGV